MDRRKFSRISLDFIGTLQGEVQRRTYSVHVRDVSLKGAFVELAKYEDVPHFFPGQKYVLTIQLQPTIKIVMYMTCRHVVKNKLGLECDRIDPESISTLKTMLENNLGRADVMNRELNVLMNS